MPDKLLLEGSSHLFIDFPKSLVPISAVSLFDTPYVRPYHSSFVETGYLEGGVEVDVISTRTDCSNSTDSNTYSSGSVDSGQCSNELRNKYSTI